MYFYARWSGFLSDGDRGRCDAFEFYAKGYGRANDLRREAGTYTTICAANYRVVEVGVSTCGGVFVQVFDTLGKYCSVVVFREA